MFVSVILYLLFQNLNILLKNLDNQQPELAGYSSTGERLTQELEEITSARSRSTLRKHYTPGDYLKYGSELDGYNSLSHNRRSLSASALARGIF